MGPVLIRQVGSRNKGDRFDFHQEKSKEQKERKERGREAILTRAGMAG